jgi:hypothetical protein
MDKINCPSREGCAAPLCPLEPHPNSQWFADEDVCNSKSVSKPHWVKTQRKIQKLFLRELITDAECFTIPTLQTIKRVRKGLRGMKPENM